MNEWSYYLFELLKQHTEPKFRTPANRLIIVPVFSQRPARFSFNKPFIKPGLLSKENRQLYIFA